ncbi:MAG: CBS domain-containing protein [Myxococcota bacterium]
MPIRLYSKSPVHAIGGDTSLDSAFERLQALGVSSLAVVDEAGRPSGVISRTDLLRVGLRQAGVRRDADLLTWPSQSVAEVMVRDVIMASPDDSVAAACGAMLSHGIHRVYVGDSDQITGVFSTRDAMEAIRDKQLGQSISETMSRPLFTIRANEPISLATARLATARVSGRVVVDAEGPGGVFTQVEALSARALARDTRVDEVMNAAIVCLPSETRLFRAVQQALAMRVRRIIVSHKRDMIGIVTGMDFARATQG